MATETETSAVDIDRSIGDFHYDVEYGHDAGVGLSDRVVNYISDVKQDPDWVRQFRLNALKTFLSKPMPTFLIISATISRRARRRNATGRTCRRTSNALSRDLEFRNRSASFSPVSKRSSTAKRFTQTSKRRSASKGSFSSARLKV